MSEETVLLDAGNGVRVTNARANLGGRTYAMANVTSVNMTRTLANRGLGKGVIFAAVSIVVGCLLEGLYGGVVVGLLGVALGYWLYKLPKDTYHVFLGSASGEAEALSSTNRDYIQEVVDALNEAIVRRG